MVCFLNTGYEGRLIAVERFRTIKEARAKITSVGHVCYAIVGETVDGRRYLVDVKGVSSYHSIDLLAQALDKSRIETEKIVRALQEKEERV